MIRRRLIASLSVSIACAGLGGCGGSYVLDGRVVEGDFGSVAFVAGDDEQLLVGKPVSGANISVYRDAGRLNQRLVATGRSDAAGRVSIPIDEFGTGWMEEQWMIEAFRSGYEPVQSTVVLPGKRQQRELLIVLAEGWAMPPQKEDLWEEYERYR